MKNLILITFILVPFFSFSQNETDISKEVSDKFETFYNAGEYQKIFELYSPEMAAALPIEKSTAFLTTLKSQVGNIKKREFIKYEGPSALYKTIFERATLGLYISVDNDTKISGALVKPFTEETESNTRNELQNYPQEIAEIIYSNCKEYPANTQLSIAIISEGKTSYYGIINEKGTLKPTDNLHKVFEIGSISKVFTSTVLASLVEEGKIKLTEDVHTFYPFNFKDDVKISFENLANHTSGLPRLPENLDLSDMANPYKNYDQKLLNEYLQNLLKLNSKPSEAYAYSNLGTGLLGYTLALSQKTSYHQLLQKRVFDKYMMSNSFVSSQNLDTRLVKGLNANGEHVPNWDFDVLFSAGGILSTTEDLVKFATAHFDPANKELILTRKQTFSMNDNLQIGLGWHLLKSEGGQDLIWHNGATGGYSSSIAIDQKNKTAVIILSNVSAFHPKMGNIDKLCFKLIENASVKQ